MNKIFTFILLGLTMLLKAQEEVFHKEYIRFEESRGNAILEPELTIPYQKIVEMNVPLNSSSGLGAVFNYYGMVLRVNQMNTRPNGDIELVLEREDNRDFYDVRPYLKAIIRKPMPLNEESVQ